MIKIDKGIPIPTLERLGRTAKYPWKAMKVGESFLFSKGIKFASCGNQASHSSRHNCNGSKFVVRRTTKGPRCWRVK